MPKQEDGYTLLEAIVVLTIMAVINFTVLPVSAELISSVRGIIAANTLKSALVRARSEAITRSENIRLCPSDNGYFCNNDGKWESGWIIYIDKSGKSLRTDKDPILQIQSSFKNVVIRKNGRDRTVKFKKTGRIGLNRSFSICSGKKTKPVIRVILIHSGRIRSDNKRIACG